MARAKHGKAILMMFLVFCLVFGGCTLQDQVLDEQMRLVVAALNAGDVDMLAPYLLPEAGDREALEKGFSGIQKIWVRVDADQVKLVQLNKNVRTAAGTKTEIRVGVYQLPKTDGLWYLKLTYRITGDEKGLLGVNVSQGQEAGAAAKSWSDTVIRLICLAAAILTIVDILRHKPRRYGWYIVLALFTFRFYTFTNGATTFALRLPLGAIIYWCLRKRILATAPSAKAKADPADVQTGEASEAADAFETPEAPQPDEAREMKDEAE